MRLSSAWQSSFGCLLDGNVFSSTFHLSVLGFIIKLLVSFTERPFAYAYILKRSPPTDWEFQILHQGVWSAQNSFQTRQKIVFPFHPSTWICPVSSTLCWRGYLSSMCVSGILVKNHMVSVCGFNAVLSAVPLVCMHLLWQYHAACYRGPVLGLTRHGDITSIVHFILDWFGYSGSSLFPRGFYNCFLYSCKECHWALHWNCIKL